MEFQLSYSKSWKLMLWKCCTQYASQFGKLSSGHRTGKCQLSFQSQRKPMAKECSNYCSIALISHTSKVMLKILQARLHFRKGRGTRDQNANIRWVIKKAREFQKNIYFCFIDFVTINCGKLWKTWEYQTTWSASWEICMQVRKQQLELDMEQQTGSK